MYRSSLVIISVLQLLSHKITEKKFLVGWEDFFRRGEGGGGRGWGKVGKTPGPYPWIRRCWSFASFTCTRVLISFVFTTILV